MDPLSITTGCIAIIGVIVKTTSTINSFVRDVRDARNELSATTRQLADLTMTLNLICDDHSAENVEIVNQIPESITLQTKSVIESCQDVLTQLDTLLAKYMDVRKRTSFKWASKGKDEVASLNKQLEAHSRTLHMSLDISTLIIARSIKTDTLVLREESRQIADDTGQIKITAARILDEIKELKPFISEQITDHRESRFQVMNRYLDSLTDYTESVVDQSISSSAASAVVVSTAGASAIEASTGAAGGTHMIDDPVDVSTPVIETFDTWTHANYLSSNQYDALSQRGPTINLSLLHETERKRTYVNQDPISILVLGDTASGKTAFINNLIRLAGNEIAMGDEGIGDNSCSSRTACYSIEISTSNYALMDMETERICSVSEFISSTDEKHLETSRYCIRLCNPEAPFLKLRLIDTPGLKRRNPFSEEDIDPFPMTEVLNTLQDLSRLSNPVESCIHATLLVIPFTKSWNLALKKSIKYYQRCIPKIRGKSSVLHTNCSVDVRGRREDQMKYFAREFNQFIGHETQQFFIENKPRSSSLYEQLISWETSASIMKSLMYQEPMSIRTLRLHKTPRMVAIDHALRAWLQRAITWWKNRQDTSDIRNAQDYKWEITNGKRLRKELAENFIPWNDKAWNLAAKTRYSKEDPTKNLQQMYYSDLYEFVFRHNDFQSGSGEGFLFSMEFALKRSGYILR